MSVVTGKIGIYGKYCQVLIKERFIPSEIINIILVQKVAFQLCLGGCTAMDI